MHRVRAFPALKTNTIGLVLGFAVGRRETPVVGPRSLFADEVARTFRQEAEKLVAGEVVGSYGSPCGSSREDAAGSQLLGKQFVFVEIADLWCPTSRR